MVAIRKKDKRKEIHRYWFKLVADIYLTGDPVMDELEERQTWNELKADIMPDYIEKNPGSRPSAFWKFELKRPCPATHAEEFDVLRSLGVMELWEIEKYQQQQEKIRLGDSLEKAIW